MHVSLPCSSRNLMTEYDVCCRFLKHTTCAAAPVKTLYVAFLCAKFPARLKSYERRAHDCLLAGTAASIHILGLSVTNRIEHRTYKRPHFFFSLLHSSFTSSPRSKMKDDSSDAAVLPKFNSHLWMCVVSVPKHLEMQTTWTLSSAKAKAVYFHFYDILLATASFVLCAPHSVPWLSIFATSFIPFVESSSELFTPLLHVQLVFLSNWSAQVI
jgi:hypothetical protein